MTLDEMKGRNWKFSGNGNCRDCGDAIEWWHSPKNNPVAINPMQRGSDQAVFHSQTCEGKNG
jgi:hypothetical protein